MKQPSRVSRYTVGGKTHVSLAGNKIKNSASLASKPRKQISKQKTAEVNGGPPAFQAISDESPGVKELEVKLLQEECQDLKARLECLKEGLVGQKPGDVEQLLKQSQRELLCLQRQLSFLSTRESPCILSPDKLSDDLSCLYPAVPPKAFNRLRVLEDKNQTLKAKVAALNKEKQHWEFSENELKDAVQENHRLSLEYARLSHKALQYDQVKSDHYELREALAIVIQERDLAVKEKNQLQAKLESLEQVLKHMREAAERRQQLQLEHEQALAVLNAKQQEIELLQKAQVEAKKEHEGAVHLLENTLDSMQAKVRELEEKCRTQSEQFNLLSKELEKFREQAGKIDLLTTSQFASCEGPSSPTKSLSQLMNGLAPSIGKVHESPVGSKSVVSEFIRPLHISDDKQEPLSVKPAFLTRSRSSSLRHQPRSVMDNDLDSTTSKQRYSGKVRLCIARYSYNPFDGPNENPEAELPLTSGKYLYVYGDMDEDGFYEGELLDGQRGLVPSNFVDFVQDQEIVSVNNADSEHDRNIVNHSVLTGESGDRILEGSLSSRTETTVINNGTGALEINIDEIGEDIVPYPRKITLIKQLAKSVIVGWESPVVPPGWGAITSYNVLVDKEVRMTIPYGSRTKALIEKLNLATCTYRITIQSSTDKGTSDELRCTLLVGKDVIVAPTQLKVDNITQTSAELSWLPCNSNYSHAIFLNDEEFDIVKAASYKYQFFNLKPNMVQKVKVLAQPHQMPWQLPLEQREKKEALVEFCTLPAGPPVPPQDVLVQAGPVPGTLQIHWKPPALTSTGTSNGANVTGYAVFAKGQKVAEVMFPTADGAVVEIVRLQSLEAREISVRTLSAQGESEDSSITAIPPELLVPPVPHPRTVPRSKPSESARAPHTKDEHMGQNLGMDESWEQTRSPSPVHGHTLEPPVANFHSPSHGRRPPSPQRILPQPQGAPISNTVAKAIAREAAQRVAETNRAERRNIFSERSNAMQIMNSDEEEEGYDSPHIKRRGASVDDFLRGSELGRQSHYFQADDYQTESSRGSDLSDIMEEDEEELYSEMQLEDGGRRRSVTSHNALKKDSYENLKETYVESFEFSPQKSHSKKLFSIPEVAEEDGENSEHVQKESLGVSCKMKALQAHKVYNQDGRQPCFLVPTKRTFPPKHRFSVSFPGVEDRFLDEKGSRLFRSATRSPDSGLDCGSEEEECRFSSRTANNCVTAKSAECCSDTDNCYSSRRSAAQPFNRKKILTRQDSIEEDFCDLVTTGVKSQYRAEMINQDMKCKDETREAQIIDTKGIFCNEDRQINWKTNLKMNDSSRAAYPAAVSSHREQEDSLLLGNSSASGRADRVEHSGRRLSHGSTVSQRPRPMMVPSIEITMDSNSEGGRSQSGSEGNISPVKEETYYRSIGGHKKWPLHRTMISGRSYDGYGSRERLSPEIYEESETDLGTEDSQIRLFVAMFDYDPRTMSPNPDAAEEELPFKEGQVIKVYGDKDTDGFYRGETIGRVGLIPCNMVSEIQTDDEEMMSQLLTQGFLPLNTPVEKIERNRRSGRRHSVTTRRMVALYDYDPRESSPNVDVEAELTFCAGDIIVVYGEIDEDGFYYGELNGHKGLVPSNFLEEVPDDVEVYLSDAPSRYPQQDTPVHTKTKRVPPENAGTSKRAPSPTVHHHEGPPTAPMNTGSPMRGREMSLKKKKGLFSKGKKLLKKLGAVK
ncbi:RIMS-binding protein 2-like isoform X3 [Protopterus annectens]|uniref:RIMS-binding protein 2-like isoform X3 n=1 Tax=Protopterus annectens TaxID=7888 RepID=UPI001CFB47CB|nr:RIMS-binding protein 2-like isoform X3 [Protopterus annectens]